MQIDPEAGSKHIIVHLGIFWHFHLNLHAIFSVQGAHTVPVYHTHYFKHAFSMDHCLHQREPEHSR